MIDDAPIIRENLNKVPSVRGSRLTVYNIMDHHLAGRTAQWVADFYRIPVEDAEAARQYVDEHLDELMPKYRRDLEWSHGGNPPHVRDLFAQAHEKLMRRKAELESKKNREAEDARAAG